MLNTASMPAAAAAPILPPRTTAAVRALRLLDIVARRFPIFRRPIHRLWTDKIGLAYEMRVLDTQLAKDVSVLIANRVISQCSFRFIPGRQRLIRGSNGEPDVRLIMEVRELIDICVCTRGAYTATSCGVWMPTPAPSRTGESETASGHSRFSEADFMQYETEYYRAQAAPSACPPAAT